MFGLRGNRKSIQKFVHPHNYSFVIGIFGAGVPATCISQNRIRQPVKMFLVQADLNNGGVVNVGDASTSLIVGTQLDPGRAMQFSVSNEEIVGSLYETPMDWQEAVRTAKSMPREDTEVNVFIDLADYFVAGDAANQRVRIFWTTFAS